jgi:hypothetical protein
MEREILYKHDLLTSYRKETHVYALRLATYLLILCTIAKVTKHKDDSSPNTTSAQDVYPLHYSGHALHASLPFIAHLTPHFSIHETCLSLVHQNRRINSARFCLFGHRDGPLPQSSEGFDLIRRNVLGAKEGIHEEHCAAFHPI